jgi:hypothetical protein
MPSERESCASTVVNLEDLFEQQDEVPFVPMTFGRQVSTVREDQVKHWESETKRSAGSGERESWEPDAERCSVDRHGVKAGVGLITLGDFTSESTSDRHAPAPLIPKEFASDPTSEATGSGCPFGEERLSLGKRVLNRSFEERMSRRPQLPGQEPEARSSEKSMQFRRHRLLQAEVSLVGSLKSKPHGGDGIGSKKAHRSLSSDPPMHLAERVSFQDCHKMLESKRERLPAEAGAAEQCGS